MIMLLMKQLSTKGLAVWLQEAHLLTCNLILLLAASCMVSAWELMVKEFISYNFIVTYKLNNNVLATPLHAFKSSAQEWDGILYLNL